MSLIEANFAKKLMKLTASQESIETLSGWVLFHKEYAETANVWMSQYLKEDTGRQMVFLYLLNDVVQRGKKDNNRFAEEFSRVLSQALLVLYNASTTKGQASIVRIIAIWNQREVFTSAFMKELCHDLKINMNDLDKYLEKKSSSKPASSSSSSQLSPSPPSSSSSSSSSSATFPSKAGQKRKPFEVDTSSRKRHTSGRDSPVSDEECRSAATLLDHPVVNILKELKSDEQDDAAAAHKVNAIRNGPRPLGRGVPVPEVEAGLSAYQKYVRRLQVQTRRRNKLIEVMKAEIARQQQVVDVNNQDLHYANEQVAYLSTFLREECNSTPPIIGEDAETPPLTPKAVEELPVPLAPPVLAPVPAIPSAVNYRPSPAEYAAPIAPPTDSYAAYSSLSHALAQYRGSEAGRNSYNNFPGGGTPQQQSGFYHPPPVYPIDYYNPNPPVPLPPAPQIHPARLSMIQSRK